MGPDRLVVPVAEHHGKALGDPLAQPFGRVAFRRPVEIDMGVIAGDVRHRAGRAGCLTEGLWCVSCHGRGVASMRSSSPESSSWARSEAPPISRSEEHTSELQSLMRISYAVFCLKTKTTFTQQ